MDLWTMECFKVLALELNFRRAADKLHISQPALSRQIQTLERDVGTTLFKRAGGTSLTSAGSSLLPDVIDLLAKADSLRSKISIQRAGHNARIRVLYNRSMPASIASKIVLEYSNKYPDLEIDTEMGWTSYNFDLLRNEEADIAFVRLPLNVSDDSLEQLWLGAEPLYLAVHESSPWKAERELTAGQLLTAPLIHWPRRQAPGSFDAIMTAIFQDSPVTLTAAQPSIDLRLAAVRENKGVAIIGEEARRDKTDGLAIIPIADLDWGFGLVWNKNTIKPHMNEFISMASLHQCS